MSRILKLGLVYFLLVFGAGFLLGPIRVLFLEPRLGSRMAELIEMPVMLGVIFFSARWIVRREGSRDGRRHLLAIGCLALALLLIAELTLVLYLRGLSLEAYLAGRDPVSGTVYLIALLCFALTPFLIARKG